MNIIRRTSSVSRIQYLTFLTFLSVEYYFLKGVFGKEISIINSPTKIVLETYVCINIYQLPRDGIDSIIHAFSNKKAIMLSTPQFS